MELQCIDPPLAPRTDFHEETLRKPRYRIYKNARGSTGKHTGWIRWQRTNHLFAVLILNEIKRWSETDIR